jgi:hypothetical protein
LILGIKQRRPFQPVQVTIAAVNACMHSCVFIKKLSISNLEWVWKNSLLEMSALFLSLANKGVPLVLQSPQCQCLRKHAPQKQKAPSALHFVVAMEHLQHFSCDCINGWSDVDYKHCKGKGTLVRGRNGYHIPMQKIVASRYCTIRRKSKSLHLTGQ